MKEKQKMKWKPVLLAAAVVLLLVSIPAFAALNANTGPTFHIRTETGEVSAGSEVRVELAAAPGRTAAGAFRMSLQYDANVFEYLTKVDAPQTQGAELFVRQSNPLVTVYTCDVQQGSAAVLSGEVATYVFKVRQDAAAGTYAFHAATDEVCDFDGKALPDSDESNLKVQIIPTNSQASSAASKVQPHLTSLAPEDASKGQLEPAFQPDVTSYQMTVPEDCAEVWFQTQQSQDTAVTVSRHTLLEAGNDTVITVTAKALGGNGERVYTIVVHRPHTAQLLTSSSTSGPKAEKITVAAPAGTGLTPAFNPDIRDYEITVPAACTEVYLNADTDSGTAVTANRHTLLAAGSDTVIMLTVASADDKSKTQYRFVVHRLAAAAKTSSASRKAGSVSSAGSKKIASSKSAANRKSASGTRSKASSKSAKAGRAAAAAGSGEAYTPSAVLGAAGGQGGLTVAGNEGFTGFQTGMLVLLLAASAAVAAVLGTRAYCRRQKGSTPEDDPLKQNTGDGEEPKK